ncbi:unnamed protein product, partial [Orchesella dallaii]
KRASSSSVVQSYFCGELSKSYDLDEVGIRDTVKIEAQMEPDSRVKQEKMDDTASCIVKQPLIAEEIIPSFYGEKEDTIEEVPIEEEKPVVLADIRETIHTMGVDDQDRNYQKLSWWEHPVWLKQPAEEWPVAVSTNDEDEIPVEEDKATATAWMHRFIPSFKMKRNPIEVWIIWNCIFCDGFSSCRFHPQLTKIFSRFWFLAFPNLVFPDSSIGDGSQEPGFGFAKSFPYFGFWFDKIWGLRNHRKDFGQKTKSISLFWFLELPKSEKL